VLDYLVEEELIAKTDFTKAMQQLLELKRLEFQERECERENQFKLKELELREKELAIQLKMCQYEEVCYKNGHYCA